MKLSELRIGDWYNSSKFNTPIKCEMADFQEIYKRADGATPVESHVSQLFEPIPLTEEWLLKFGFDLAVNGWWDKSETYSIYLEKEQSYLRCCTVVITTYEIKHVHQLQNLYFALTGKEL